MTRTRRSDSLAVAALVALPCLWWWPVFAGYLPDFMDSVAQFYPMRMAAAQQVREGTLPLWLPNIFSGAPLAANPQIAVWYPLQWIMLAAPGPTTYGLVAVLHYILAGIGMHALLRRMGRGTLAAFFAALTFQFGSMLVSRMALMPHVYTTTWIPWMFVAIERAARERGWMPGRGALAVAAFFALQLLAGAPQIAYYTAIALPIVWLARRAAFAPRRDRAKWIGQAVVHGACAATIAALLASIQIVPTLEFLGQTARSSIPVEQLKGQALNGEFLWRAIVGYSGNPIEDTDSINAIGIGATLLACAAMARRRTRRVAWPFLAVSVVGWLLSVGDLAPLWTKVLPMFGGFHAPRRALILWSVCGCVMAGLGAANLVAFARMKKLRRVVAPAALLLLTAGTWWMLPRLERVWTREDRLFPNERVVAMLGTDRYVAIDPTLHYAHGSRRFDYGASMMMDLSCLHGTMDANGYDPLVPRRLAFAQRVACARSGVFYPSHGVYFTDPNSPVLELLNVQYVVGRWDLFDPSIAIPGATIDKDALRARVDVVHRDLRWPVHRFKDERPLAWCVEHVVATADAEDALLAAVANDPRRVAFVEEGVDLSFPNAPRCTAEYRDARTIRVRLDEAPAAGAFACVAVSWMPGWRATTPEGEELLAMPTDGLIAGVAVPPGVREFELKYAPSSLRNGALGTLLGLVLLGTGWRRRRATA